MCYYVEPERRRRRTESGGVSLDDILEPVKEELVSHFTFKDIVQLSYVCKFLYIWAHSVCGLLEESISGGHQKPKWNNRWVIEEMKMYPADEIGVEAWPQISFKYKTQQGSQNVPDWARNSPNVFVSMELWNISDVSALGNVHTLNLSLCDNISDVSALRNVKHLTLPKGNVEERE